MPVKGRDLEVIFLIAYGWTVREVGTRKRIVDNLPDQEAAISAARAEASDRLYAGARTVEVYIKTKWLKRIRDTRTYGADRNPPRG